MTNTLCSRVQVHQNGMNYFQTKYIRKEIHHGCNIERRVCINKYAHNTTTTFYFKIVNIYNRVSCALLLSMDSSTL